MARQEPELSAEPRFGGDQRRHQPALSAATPAAPKTSAAPKYSGIGVDLSEERQKLGLGLEDVAAMLRIQPHYLAAIEEGRYGDLPGATYAVGFLRSYAGLLGLDSQAVVEAFKAESSVRPGAKRLVMPEPIQEARRPRGLAIVLSVLVAGAIYAGWAYLDGEEPVSLEQVPAPPDRLMGLLNGGAADTSTAPAAEPLAPPAFEPPASQVPAPPSAPAAAAPAAAPEPADAAASPAAQPATDPARPEPDSRPQGSAAPTPANESSGAVQPEPSTSPGTGERTGRAEPAAGTGTGSLTANWREERRVTATVETEPSTPVRAQPAALSMSPPAFPTADPAPSQAEDASPADAAPSLITNAGGPTAQIYGLASAGSDARVKIRASDDSWVQVKGPDNELLLTRILRAGDSYIAPNRPDIVMMTGNAGGLEIIVDGRSLGAPGPNGAVVRNISLDPETLLAAGLPQR